MSIALNLTRLRKHNNPPETFATPFHHSSSTTILFPPTPHYLSFVLLYHIALFLDIGYQAAGAFQRLVPHYPEAAAMVSRAMCECDAPRWPWLARPPPPLSLRFEQYHRSAAHILSRALVRRQLRSTQLLTEQSQVLLRLGAVQAAVAVARAATTCGTRQWSTWFNLALIYVEAGCPRSVAVWAVDLGHGQTVCD